GDVSARSGGAAHRRARGDGAEGPLVGGRDTGAAAIAGLRRRRSDDRSPGYAVVSFRTFAAGPPHCALSRGPATRGYVSRRVVGLRGGPHRKKPHHRRPALPTRP